MGRSRGGLTTKIHAVTDAQGTAIKIALTPGQVHDAKAADAMLDGLTPAKAFLGDKAYDADWIRERLAAQGLTPNIPPRRDRLEQRAFDKGLYKQRNQVERFFNRIKHFRRIATRYEKLAANYLAMIKLAVVRIKLRSYESMA